MQAQGNNPQGAPLSNVVDVTLEVDAGTPGNAAAIRNQLAALVSGKTYLDVSSLCQLIITHLASQMMCLPTDVGAVLYCRVLMVAESLTGHAQHRLSWYHVMYRAMLMSSAGGPSASRTEHMEHQAAHHQYRAALSV